MSVRQVLVAVGVGVALLIVPSAVADVPVWDSFLPNISVPVAENSSTATVSWTDPTATAPPSLDPVSVSCDHSPGAYPLGSVTTVVCTATDTVTLVDKATQSFTITVTNDTTPPVLVLPPNQVVEVEGLGTKPVTWTATPSASDAGGSISPPTCNPRSGESYLYGTTTVMCTADDGGGNVVPGSFTVTLSDTTVPTIAQLPDINNTAENVSSAPVSYVPVASDAGGPISAPTCSPASGSSFVVNAPPTTVTCNVSDGVNSAAPMSFKVSVKDTTAPVITVPPPVTVNINNAISAPVTFVATATDASSTSSASCLPASGSSFPLGVTTVTCNASDPAGNAAVPKSFTVTVVDNTPPVVAVTSGPPALTDLRTASLGFTTSEGTTTCQLDGGAFAACSSPAAYSGLADGAHTFTVKATDAANNSATASRAWSVDATPPVLSLPSTRVNEADGPNGAIASFTVSAADSGGALLPSAVTCTPGSGTLFPLGTTTVTCRVTDAAGNSASGSFDVVVQDTTPPAINAPNVSFTATSADGVKKTDPDVVAYLAGISATDLVSTPTLTNDMPAVLPIGTTTVVFKAKDAAGNSANKSVTVTVLPVGQKAPPPDLTPPGDVLGAAAKPGDRTVTLSWKPLAKDVAFVTVTEFVTGEAGGGKQIYSGSGTGVTAKGLVNGTSYRFLIIAFDQAGNRSKGLILTATPKAEALTSPKQAQRVTAPPLLRWAPSAGASYYNVQLWRGSTKLLSTWPVTTRLQLTAKWTFSGKARKLAPGLYTWYVWPGLGARADAHYGPLLGSRTFTYVLPKKKPKPKS